MDYELPAWGNKEVPLNGLGISDKIFIFSYSGFKSTLGAPLVRRDIEIHVDVKNILSLIN